MVGPFVGWSIGWLVDCQLVDCQLVGFFVGWLVDMLVGLFVGWFVGWWKTLSLVEAG